MDNAEQSRAGCILGAVDRFLDTPLTEEEKLARFRAAVDAAFGIAPYLEDGATYIDAFRENDRLRAERLERDWHG